MPLIIVSANVREIFSIKKGADRIWNRKFTRQAIVTTSLGYFRIFWSKVQYWWAWLLCIPRPLIIVSGHQWNVNACTLGMTNSTTDVIYFFFFSYFFFWNCFYPLCSEHNTCLFVRIDFSYDLHDYFSRESGYINYAKW